MDCTLLRIQFVFTRMLSLPTVDIDSSYEINTHFSDPGLLDAKLPYNLNESKAEDVLKFENNSTAIDMFEASSDLR